MKRMLRSFGLAAISLASSTTAALQTYKPLSSSSPEYTIGIPSSSSISSSSSGAIYIQIKAPTSYQWVGFGIGAQMANARIFVMYADGEGNVTVSARDGGQGHVMPQWDQGLQNGVKVLEGTGIVDGNMVANFRCDSSTLTTSKSDSASSFIAAWMSGSALNSNSLEATIRQHSGDSYRQLEFDLSKASLSSDSNPFLSSSSNPSSSNNNTSSGGNESENEGNDDSKNGGGSSSGSSGGATVVGTSGKTIEKYQKAHGITMSVAILLLFPSGAIYMRLGGGVWGHAALQVLSLMVLIAGFGLGIHLAQIRDLLFKQAHTILGTTIFALLLLQPFLGLLHHHFYRKTQSRTPVSYIHIWLGRIALALGFVCGGVGLKLANNTTGGKIAYGVVAGVVGITYIVLVVLKRKGGKAGGGAVVDARLGRREKGEVSANGSSS